MNIADDKFEVAKKIAEAACALDTAKMSWPDVDQLWYRIFAEKMYDVAEKLAGDRKDEALYGAVRGVEI